jgi:NhaP-type Na+/H+ or K+/H+ antiporter
MSTDDILLGLGLVLVLAVSSQLLARRLGIPAIVVLLPAGFVAGVATDDVHPDALLGSLYQPFVSIAVGVILFEAGLRLSFREIAAGIRSVVTRLVAIGVLVSWIGIAVTAALLYGDMDRGVALLIGAILVVSGPTVVLPLLAFIRPSPEVRSLLKWEGVLIDPVGALLGVVVFHGVRSGGASSGWRPGEMLLSIGVGALVGAAGAAVLWTLLGEIHRNAPRQAIAATVMVVVAAVVAADLIREDAGFMAATLMGIALGNQRRIDVSLVREFQETLVQLLIGVLFVLIAASVSPSDIRAVLPEAVVLVAVMVLLLRPLAVAVATWRSKFSWRERTFVAWMAPRGIVAGATASAFGLELAHEGVAGAESVLPIVFVAIFGTVVLYGLTGPVAARMLGLAGAGRRLVLVISGHPWAIEIASALKGAGVAVRMWVGPPDELAAARAAGLDADRGRMMLDALERETELEDITDALLLTRSDDFNAVAADELRDELGHGHVFRVAPDPNQPDLLPPSGEAGILGDGELTFAEVSRRLAAGGKIVVRRADTRPGPDVERLETPLFAVAADGRLSVAADGRPLVARPGDTVIALALGDRAEEPGVRQP